MYGAERLSDTAVCGWHTACVLFGCLNALFFELSRYTCLQIRASVRKGIVDMASSNLEKEQLISEVKNHIAIVRCGAVIS